MTVERSCPVCDIGFVFVGYDEEATPLLPPHRLAEQVPNAKGTFAGRPILRATGPWCPGAER